MEGMNTIQIIYLVDDDPDDRFFIRQAIQQVQHEVEVIEATSGFELLTLVQEQKRPFTSLILMDINMPKMDGVETVRLMRSDRTLPAIPVIMISTTSNPSYIKSAYEAGASGFLSKPSTLHGFRDMANELRAAYLI